MGCEIYERKSRYEDGKIEFEAWETLWELQYGWCTVFEMATDLRIAWIGPMGLQHTG